MAVVDLGRILREAREQAGLPQHLVAERVGVTASALSRWESGHRPVPSDDADRVLAACRLDVRFRLVPRHLDLTGSLRDLARQPLYRRMMAVQGLVGLSYLDGLQATGSVVSDGAWAAAALALPHLQQVGGLLLRDDPVEQARVQRALQAAMCDVVLEGGLRSVMWEPTVLQRWPEAEWLSPLLGRFRTAVVAALPAERRVRAEEAEWRVIDPGHLVPEHVDAAALTCWEGMSADPRAT
ncbi:MAG: multiprotein-bridging factor 1 family protein [Mycobacteriales bacterium]